MERRDFIQAVGLMPVAATLAAVEQEEAPKRWPDREFFLLRKLPNRKRELHELSGWLVDSEKLLNGDAFLIFDYNECGYAYVHDYYVRDSMKMGGWIDGKRSASCTAHYLSNSLLVTKINGVPCIANDYGMCEQS